MSIWGKSKRKEVGLVPHRKKGDCLLVMGCGEKLHAPSQTSREEEARAGSSRKCGKPQECFQKGRLSKRDQRNAQTRTPVRGRVRAREVVEAEQNP